MSFAFKMEIRLVNYDVNNLNKFKMQVKNIRKDIENDIRRNISYNLNSDSNRNWEEIPYQDFMRKNAKDLYSDLIHPSTFKHLYDNYEYLLLDYWKYLIESGYSIRDYREKAKEIGSFTFYHNLSYFCSHYLKDAEAALEYSRESENYIEDKNDHVKYLNDLSECYSTSWDFEKALSFRIKSLELKEKTENELIFIENVKEIKF